MSVTFYTTNHFWHHYRNQGPENPEKPENKHKNRDRVNPCPCSVSSGTDQSCTQRSEMP